MKSEELYKNISASSSRMSGEVARCTPGDLEKPAGITLIADERERQITKEGFDAEHDEQWECLELVSAAMCYLHANKLIVTSEIFHGDPNNNEFIFMTWPFHRDWWKPSDDQIRNLVKAGALIAAEIDRLQATKDGQK